ncbi:WD40 repeat protein [Thermocatellispora tengchongensis]|uniref:WD40 repeat protein n=1 Tax=Thermocatellispora tengchongensis TaxID=1073253 RepID=A0A840PRH0_9ACTN|nr:protein kinase [Thermocatellispora tengchongensis]MBB5138565.1 WD40 repeat protein [Thermocatellispora tengchongensis]
MSGGTGGGTAPAVGRDRGEAGLRAGDPRAIGDYVIARRLGSGGQGVVYEAYDPAGRRVAVKVVHVHLAGNAEVRARFAKEAMAAQRVASFCTARVLEARLDGERPYIVSEFVDGPSLGQAVERAGPYTGDALHRMATGIATALVAIHQADVIHRDLKPDNVLLGSDGLRVVDFGIARTAEMSLTSTGHIAGTPLYLSPEAAAGRRTGRPADVWAWGAIVVYAASGRHAFAGTGAGHVLHRILTDEPDLGAVPEPLRDLVRAALDKNPDRRPSAMDLLVALVAGPGAQGGAGGAADPVATGSRAASGLRPPVELAGAPSLGAVAERVYEGLDPEARAAVPQLLLRMVMPATPGVEMPRVLTTVEVESLARDSAATGPPGAGTAVERGLGGLLSAGLVVREEDGFTLASPALPRAWPRMRGWLEADREGLLVHHRMSDAARLWHEHGRKTADLYQGTRLEEALRWAATGRHVVTLNRIERDYLDAGVALTHRRTRRRRLVTVALSVMLAVSLGAGALAEQQRRVADGERRKVAAQLTEAVSRQLVAEAETLRPTDPALGMLLTAAAWRLTETDVTRGGLYGSLAQPELDVFTEPGARGGAAHGMAADGTTFAAVSDGRARVWDVRTRRRIADFPVTGVENVTAVAVSPDGGTVAVGGAKEVRLWDVRSGRQVGDPIAGAVTGGGGLESFWPGRGPVVGFSPGGGLLITRGDFDDGVRVWDLEDRRVVLGGREKEPDIGNVAISPDDKVAAVVARTGPTGVTPLRVELWDLAGGGRLRTLRLPAEEVIEFTGLAFSPDGRTVAVSGSKGVVLFDTGTGARQGEAPYAFGAEDLGGSGENLQLTPAVFTADGRYLAAADVRGTTRIGLWRVGRPHDAAHVFPGEHGETVPGMWFEPGDTALRVLTGGGSVTRLDVGPFTRPIRFAVDETGPAALIRARRALSPDGRLLATINATTRDGNGAVVRLWNVGDGGRAGDPVAELRADTGGDAGEEVTLVNVAFSGDGRTLAALTGQVTDRTVTLWDVPTRDKRGSFPLTSGQDDIPVTGERMALDRDGGLLATTSAGASGAGTSVHVFDVRERAQLGMVYAPYADTLAFAPGGGTLAVNGQESPLIALPGVRAAEQPFGPNSSHVSGVAYSADGRTVATVTSSGRISLWDARTRDRIGLPIEGPDSPLGTTVLRFSPDGRILALATGHEVHLWDVATHRRLGLRYAQHAQDVNDLAFSADGSTLYSVDEDGALRAYVIDPERAAERVCARAGRDLTEAEWRRHAGELPYRPVCGQ